MFSEAILGFEYGYSVEEGAGLALTMWEARFCMVLRRQ